MQTMHLFNSSILAKIICLISTRNERKNKYRQVSCFLLSIDNNYMYMHMELSVSRLYIYIYIYKTKIEN